MSRKRLPLRPNTSTRYTLSDAERYALCCYCVFECTKLDVFKLAHPEISGTRVVLKSQAEQFFASFEVDNFIREYREMLNSEVHEETPKVEDSEAGWTARTTRLRRTMYLKGEGLIEDETSSKDQVELGVKLVEKSGELKDEEASVEQPRRYLPETCSQCRYKVHCEQECEDLCEYCKYKKYGEDNGVHYESEKQLEMPTGEKKE